MPTGLLVFVTFVIVLIICAGALGFPYLLMLFGVYGSEKHSVRGKLLALLIWLFPVLSIACLYSAWASNPYMALLPFAYIVLVWSLRANKGVSVGTAGGFTTKSDILKGGLDRLEARWSSWKKLKSPDKYMQLTFVAPNTDDAESFRTALTASEHLYQAVDWDSNQNGTLTVYVRIVIDSMDKNRLIVLVMRMIDVSWEYKCKLVSFDVLEPTDQS